MPPPRSSRSSRSSKHAADDAAAVPPPPPSRELIRRGVKKRSPLGTAVFLALRTLDIPLQYQLLSGAWSVPLLTRAGVAVAAPVVSKAALAGSGAGLAPLLSRLGIAAAGSAGGRTGIAAIDRLGLSRPSTLLLAMAAGATIKHSYWLVAIAYEEFRPPAALVVSAFNSTFNSINSLLLVAAATSAATTGPFFSVPSPLTDGSSLSIPAPMAVGAALYVIGMGLELGSELQRLRFKKRPENKGLICRTGLWGMARHINYAGYTLWRTGFSLAAGGWIAGAVAFAFNATAFIKSSTVELESYMSRRYGEQWSRYKRDTKWLLLPYVY